MARTRAIQNSLITGVIAPTLLGRIDLEKYYSAVEEAENVVIMPHGGMERRSGLKYLTGVATGSRLFSFEFSISQNYVMVMSTANIKVYLPGSGAVLATEAWGTPLTSTQINEMDIIQSADTVIITHEDFNPIQVQRQGSDTAWAISDIPLTNIPKFDFDSTLVPDYINDGTSTTTTVEIGEIVYDEVGTNLNISDLLYKAVTQRVAIDLSTEAYANTTNWEVLGQRSDVWGVTAETPDYTNDGTSQVITTALFDIVYNNDGNDINGLDGYLYLAETIRVGVDLATDDFSNTTNWRSLGVYDNTDRGWVRTCTFHQGRLWFGGSKSKPTSIWASVINDFYNFDTGGTSVKADDGIFDTLDTDQFNAIQNVVSGRNLQVMTASGEFINTEDIITPTSSAWLRQTGYGAKRVKPVTLDGSTYFMDRYGKTLRGFLYNDTENGYTTPPLSILAEHIINDVQDLDIVRGSSLSVSNLLYLVNADGTVAVFNTMRSENISGWTKWTTSGTFKRVTVTSDVVSFIVERDGAEYLEVLDDSVLLDHTFSATTAEKVEVDQVLFDNEIRVVGDSITQTAIAAVDESGTYYAYADDTVDVIYAGLNYTVKVKTLPVAVNTKSEGNIIHLPRRITRCILSLYESRGIYVNGNLVTNRKFGDALDQVFAPITGIESVYLLGYNTKAQVEITQENPDPMTLLSLDLEVSY